jgi:hypothetical protein
VLTPGGLVVALVISLPALWDALQGTISLTSALLRLLAAFVVVAVATAVLRKLFAPTSVLLAEEHQPGGETVPQRRRDDA